MITYRIEDNSNFTRYVFSFIFATTGFAARETSDVNADVYYGDQQVPLPGKISFVKNKSDVIWKELIQGQISADVTGPVIPFDVVNAIGFFLNDVGNRDLESAGSDNHDRLFLEESFQYKSHLANFPVVNLYIAFLRALFERVFHAGLPMWPGTKKAAICLSHDVDNPDRYSVFGIPLFNKNAGLQGNAYLIRRKTFLFLRRLLDTNTDDHWLFTDIMNAEQKFGFKSTFFFATTNRFGEWGSPYDVLYDIRHPKFDAAFEGIRDRGFEVGLHASYNAFVSPDRFIAERQMLSKISKYEVRGLRHHYWHLGKDIQKTLNMHAQAGFQYDSSVAFEEGMGYRRNVALPYYPWNDAALKPIETIQLPVFCMDGDLSYHRVAVDEAIEEVVGHIKTIKSFGGIGVINWHVQTSYPGNRKCQDMGKTYLGVLERMSKDPDLWVTSLGEVASWLKKREETLSSEILDHPV